MQRDDYLRHFSTAWRASVPPWTRTSIILELELMFCTTSTVCRRVSQYPVSYHFLHISGFIHNENTFSFPIRLILS